MNRKQRRQNAKQRLVLPGSQTARQQIRTAWMLVQRCRDLAAAGDFQEALQHLDYARQLFKRFPSDPTTANGLAQCKMYEGVLFWKFNDLISAILSLEEALREFRDLGDRRNEASCEHFLGVVLIISDRRDEAMDHLEAAREQFEQLNLPAEVARADHRLGQVAGIDKRYLEAERLLISAQRTFERLGMVHETADALEALSRVYLADKRPVEAEPLLRKGLRLYRAIGHELGLAFCSELLAKVLDILDQKDEALKSALAAICLFDKNRYAMDNTGSRDMWAKYQHDPQTIALEIAIARNDVDLAAELIETARSQGTPAIDSSSMDRSPFRFRGGSVPSGLSIIPSVRLDRGKPVAIHGKTRLGADRAEDAVELTRVLSDFAGPDGWWWGTWQVGGRLWWSLVKPGGSVEAGCVDCQRGTRLREVLEEYHGALPLGSPGEKRAERLRRGLLFDCVAEQALADRLGEALLPSSLRDELRARADSNDPIPLVIASCEPIGRISMAALGLGNGRRVVDAATIRMAPSAGMIDRLSREAEAGRRGIGGPGNIHVGVFGPAAGVPLPQAEALSDHAGTATALIGTQATRSRLAATLRSEIARPGVPGVFVYAGHALIPRLGVSLLCLHRPAGEPSLCPLGECCGGNPLTVHDLLQRRPGPAGFEFPMPGRAFLSGCDTAGASQVGAGGEWMGLAPAFLWAGARVVVGTLWPTLDHPASLAFEVAIVDALKTSKDPAISLRNLQRGALDRWRARTPLTAADGVPEASPFHWAAYVAVGFASA